MLASVAAAAHDIAAGYPALKQAHVTLVLSSGALFALRGAALLAHHAWPLRRGVRVLAVCIDVALLGAGVALWVQLQLHPLRDPWLATKLALLPVYVALGWHAFRGGSTPGVRALAYAAALTLYLVVIGVALAHHPLGWMRAPLT